MANARIGIRQIVGQFIGALAIMLSVTNAVAGPGRVRDKKLLDLAVQAASEEKASLEKAYKVNEARLRKSGEREEDRTIAVEIGDGLAAEGGDTKLRGREKAAYYQERAAFSKLDKEWKEVNRSLHRTHPEGTEVAD